MEQLRTWRKSANITVEDAAAQVGVGRVQWYRWETGVRGIPPTRVLEIERVTGISRHDLRPDLYPRERAA